MLAAEVIRTKRDGGRLSPAQIDAFVAGIVDGGWSEGQIAALAMAILLRGMDRAECSALTRAMTHSGQVLDWRGTGFGAPLLDKHSTGGVGDKVSLVLAPIVAACGAIVPMISGRGLGHTGGTLDKLEALPGYDVRPARERLIAVLRAAGCAIVGAGDDLAPADRRLYAIRDITATVESLPLITASILSKKLAAGLQALVLDVKVGNGAFCVDTGAADALARSLVEVATAAGLTAEALLTDMSQVLGTSAGNAVEVRESIDFLAGRARAPRLEALTLALAARMLRLGGLARDLAAGQAMAAAALADGRAAEALARMVAGLGGPRDVFADARLPVAPVQRDLVAWRDGFVAATDTRAIGLAIVALGGGRQQADDRIDARVGITAVVPLGTAVRAGDALLCIHAASDADAAAAALALRAAITIADPAPECSAIVQGLVTA